MLVECDSDAGCKSGKGVEVAELLVECDSDAGFRSGRDVSGM